MARARRRPDGRDDYEDRSEAADEVEEAERPLDSGTIQSLREAEPQARAQTILRLQRLHGNAAVQRVIRSLQLTDASRDARVQMIGERAEEPAPSGRIEKAALYRDAIEAELDAAPLAAKSERELVQDSVNTIGQIFANYQAALHLFEEAVQHGAGEAVPRELAKEVLREGARDVLEPVMAAAAEAVGGAGGTAGAVYEYVADTIGVTDRWPAEQPRQPGASAPAFALRNLVVAERRRIAAAQMRLLKAQVSFSAAAEHKAETGGSSYRTRLMGASKDLNELEQSSHSADGIFKTLMERYRDAAKGRADVTIMIDPEWRVVRAHIKAPRGHKLAGQLLADHSGWFDLNDLHLTRHVTWEPAELAVCEALIDERGVPRRFDRNEKGGQYFDEFQAKLRADGLPRTQVLTGD
jgi:hypothetical protein